MEDRFDRLEHMIGELGGQVQSVEQRLGGIDQRFDGIDQKFDAVTREFAGVNQRFDDLGQRVGVLHEEVLAEFRFSLEAVQGAKEELSRKIDERTDAIDLNLDLIAKAVRTNRIERV